MVCKCSVVAPVTVSELFDEGDLVVWKGLDFIEITNWEDDCRVCRGREAERRVIVLSIY